LDSTATYGLSNYVQLIYWRNNEIENRNHPGCVDVFIRDDPTDLLCGPAYQPDGNKNVYYCLGCCGRHGFDLLYPFEATPGTPDSPLCSHGDRHHAYTDLDQFLVSPNSMMKDSFIPGFVKAAGIWPIYLKTDVSEYLV
jgi:hypothetical protein